MGSLFSYSIGVGITLLVLYIVYKWLLASENQPRLNRIALMSIYALAFALPLAPNFSLSIGASHRFADNLVTIGQPVVEFIGGGGSNGIWLSLIVWVYGMGVLVVTARTILTAIKLYTLVKDGRKTPRGDYVLVYTDRNDVAPFSWGKYMVMNHDEETSNENLIITHELAHIRGLHFVDLLVSQLTCALLWYNPASWLMQNELKAVHEYEADENVLKSGCDARQYQLLLVKKAVGQRFPSLANSLNHSKLKKRITMMYSKKTSAARKTRVLALAPAAALGLLLLNVPTVSEAMATASNANMSVSSVSESKVTTNYVDEQSSTNKSGDEVLMTAEKLPEFEGGLPGLMQFVTENITYPEEAMAADVQGYVVVQFTVTKNGEVEDAKVVRSVEPSLDAEAVRVVKATSGKWTPGTNKGENVNVQFSLPISFKTK